MNDDGFTEIGGGDAWNGKDSNLKIGDSITGTYVRHQSNVGRNNAQMYTLRTTDGDLGVWGSTVLDGRMEQTSIGDIVRITYLGESEKPGAYGKPFKLWKVESKPGAGQPAGPSNSEVVDAKLDANGDIDLKDLGY